MTSEQFEMHGPAECNRNPSLQVLLDASARAAVGAVGAELAERPHRANAPVIALPIGRKHASVIAQGVRLRGTAAVAAIKIKGGAVQIDVGG